ncbi:hypothetical protein [Halorhabdus rudnickae]|uniref:hypothetical protein n=1 Tax=Halorhabdus rudnickae TaxID=1775544 RepID=UPI0014384041|nr:hypothetical protein [Halorhabdus rudnickae]
MLVIDNENGRFGFLEAGGSVNCLGGDIGGIGALGSAIVQNPDDALQERADGLANVDIE